ILPQLNADFLASAQNGDVRRFEQILAEDFMASMPDFLLRDKKQFLDMMAAPRPFTELKADEVRIRLLGDFAIIHAHMTLRTADGVQREGMALRGGERVLGAALMYWRMYRMSFRRRRSGMEVKTPRAMTSRSIRGEPQFNLIEPGRVSRR